MTESKGRPTPKRREKVRRTGPVTPPPLTRKEAAQRQKEAAKAARARVREGALAGDERYLAKRDAGPERAVVRDVVDARRNVGVILLPLALVLIVTNLTGLRALQELGLLLWLAAIIAMVVDLVATTVLIRRRVREANPEATGMFGHVTYGLLRSTVLRRFRLPPPRVSPGRR